MRGRPDGRVGGDHPILPDKINQTSNNIQTRIGAKVQADSNQVQTKIFFWLNELFMMILHFMTVSLIIMHVFNFNFN